MAPPRGRPKKRLEAFTPEHFKAYASRIVLDNGAPWEVEDFQMEVFEPILSGVTEVWGIIPEGNTKCLDALTPLPTPNGFMRMLDVCVGDQLLGSDGMPTNVLRTSELKLGQDCYRITFSDGAQIVCDGDHLWQVEDAQDHYNASVRSTRYLANRPLTLHKKGKSGRSEVARWRIPTARRRALPDDCFNHSRLIEPYALGVWLGDGTSACGRITNVDQEVWDRIDETYQVGPLATVHRARTHTVYGLQRWLRALGLLQNKHIPWIYTIAPEGERWELLQGLIDSDGKVSEAGQVTYTTTSERLAEDVRHLVWSLGLPCTIRSFVPTLNGVRQRTAYDLTVSCDARHPVASLSRKKDRLKQYGLTCDHRRIVKIESIPSVPVKCVEVDAPDRLYLASEALIPTHNTTMMAGMALYHADFTSQPWVPIAASSRDQAEILAQQAYGMIRQTPGLLNRFRIYEGYRKIMSLANHGRGIKVYAADANTGDGVIPTLALCDEGHRWPDLSLYRLWKGKLGKRNGQIVMISTAGDPGGEFEEMRDAIREKATRRKVNGAHIRSEGAKIVMNEWRVEHEAFIQDFERVKAANPFSGITVQSLEDQFNSPTTDLGDWKRLKCNIPSRTTLAAITEVEWSVALAKEHAIIPPDEHVDCGCDVAWKHDTFAIAPLWRDLDNGYNLLGKPAILTPPRDGTTLHPDEVKQSFMAINDVNPIDAVVIDIERAEDIAAWLEDELGITVIDRAQGNANAVEDYDAFMKGLRNGTLKHIGDDGLHRHVMNAIARMLPGDKKRFDRPSQSRAKKRQQVRVIDALTAAAMVNHYAGEFSGGEPLVAWR